MGLRYFDRWPKPAYHSKQNGESAQVCCGCAIRPLNTTVRGPAPPAQPGKEDIVEETLYFFRANVLFLNYQIEGAADRTLIYLTSFTQQCLKEIEKHPGKKEASRALTNLTMQNFSAPGQPGWHLGTLFPGGTSVQETEQFKSYIRQCCEELAKRMCDGVYVDEGGTRSKHWMLFSKRKFMGKEML
ncbi:unnamed protein product [Pylaiella littoralis]